MTETAVVSLKKGENVSLTKEAPGLSKVAIGLGWDARTTTGADFDLDASAIMCGTDGKALSKDYFVYYNSALKNDEAKGVQKGNPMYGTIPSPDGSILHTGDNLTGDGDGDDETINVDLDAVPATVDKIVIPVSIYEADERSETFGDVSNAYIHVVDQSTGKEIARYDLKEDASGLTALVFAELYRYNGEWKFRAIGQGYASGLAGIVHDYGLNTK